MNRLGHQNFHFPVAPSGRPDDALLNRVERGFCAGSHPDFAENIAQVNLDRVHADKKFRGNILVALSLTNKLQNLYLAIAEG